MNELDKAIRQFVLLVFTPRGWKTRETLELATDGADGIQDLLRRDYIIGRMHGDGYDYVGLSMQGDERWVISYRPRLDWKPPNP